MLPLCSTDCSIISIDANQLNIASSLREPGIQVEWVTWDMNWWRRDEDLHHVSFCILLHGLNFIVGSWLRYRSSSHQTNSIISMASYGLSRAPLFLPLWRLCFVVSTTLISMGAVSHNIFGVQANSIEEVVIDAAQGTVQMNNNDDTMDYSISYGVDTSWPMQYETVALDRPNPLGVDARQFAYKEYMQGCIVGDDEITILLEECRRFEADRISMNLKQPAISQNYTHAGFAKVEAPAVVLKLLQRVWDEHYEKSKVLERWEPGNTYLNHWQSPTHMVDITQILSQSEQWRLVEAVQSVLEAWTQQPLVMTSLYGIRIYGNEAVLAPHVDRLPLVSSAIINIAQEVDEPWVLEVIGHDGKATNLTMEPGDMVLYESHSVLHGRPFPLKGNYFANVFVHFEPLGHSFRHMQNAPQESAKAAYERALAQHQQHREASNEFSPKTERSSPSKHYANDKDTGGAPTAALPHYVPPEKAGRWRQQFEYEKEFQISPKPTRVTLGNVNPHFAAADGLLDLLKEIAAKDRSLLFKKDRNGWRPLHEAARGGHLEVIRYLLEEGAQVNERTNDDEGGNPLYLAEKKNRKKAIALLKEYGGVSLAPKAQNPSISTETDNDKDTKNEDVSEDQITDGTRVA